MKKKAVIIFLIFTFIITSGFGCKTADKQTQAAMKPITLNYWRVWDGPDAFDDIITQYRQLHPFVTINYKKLRYDEYEKELLEALAEDRGPDIFSVHNTWVRKYENKIYPMPESITMAYPVEKGTIKKEIVPELRTYKSISLKEIKNNFVDVVYDDVVIKNKDEKTGTIKEQVFGLPLSVDNMAMYYNKDLLNNAGIAEAPAFWNKDFQEAVKRMTKQDENGNILQAGASLGGSANIERSSDIISLLMMQNGSIMLEDGKVQFQNTPKLYKDQNYSPAPEALRFYTDFANPAKEVYSWNDKLDNSLNMFAQGKLALFFGYAYHLPFIKASAPKLNFSIAKMPQIEGGQNVNFANYWVETVSNKSKNPAEAWDFVQFATKAAQAKTYLSKTKKPTALRALISEGMDDPDIGIFAEQVLTAKSWYKGKDSSATEIIMEEMIDAAVISQENIDSAIKLSAQRIQQTLQ